MLSVLLAHNYYRSANPSGENVVFEAEADLLGNKGHRVYKYVRHSDEILALSKVGRASMVSEMIWSRRSYREIKTLIAETRPDVAHFHNMFPLISISALRACREMGLPVVQTLHNFRPLCLKGNLFRDNKPCQLCVSSIFGWQGIAHSCYQDSLSYSLAASLVKTTQRILNSYMRDVQLFITPSEAARQIYIAAGYNAAKIKVKPHFVDLTVQLHSGERDFCLFVGRLDRGKGIEVLISAWRRLPEVPLVIIGDGPENQNLRDAARQIKNIRFVGAVNRSEVLEYIRRANCLVVPSQVPETFGLVAIEGLACGTPVVASSAGALPEIVTHEYSGLLYDSSDEVGLANHVRWLWKDRSYANRLGANARKDYENRFTGDVNYKQLIRRYAEACDQQ